MARTYYKACLDTNETTDARGSEPLMDFIQEIGGWNISGTFEESSWDFQRTLQTLHNKYNRGGGLLNWAVGADEKNSTQNVLQLDQANLILPTRDYYLNRTAHEKVINAYLSYMTKVGVLLGGNESETRAQMEQVLEFETRIANVSSISVFAIHLRNVIQRHPSIVCCHPFNGHYLMYILSFFLSFSIQCPDHDSLRRPQRRREDVPQDAVEGNTSLGSLSKLD